MKNCIRISLSVLTITPFFMLSMERAIDPTTPLKAIDNKLITGKRVTRAFDESFDQVCGIVVASHNLRKTGKWIKSNGLKAQISAHVSQIREYNENVYAGIDRSRSKRRACFGKLPGDRDQSDEAACTLHMMNIKRLKNAHESLIRKIETLSAMVEQVQASGLRPEYLNDAHVLAQAVERQIMWKDIKIGCQYGLFALGLAVAGATGLYLLPHKQ
jgi:hypothetical protein